ncbi:MAG: hypothetical protein E7311_01070 [Clostridiales bacterium]|nr:hypothetical protein [Clostridiales bacterium]
MTKVTAKCNARQRESRTKELPLKQRVKNYMDENPLVSKKDIANHFGISTKELSIVLGKI